MLTMLLAIITAVVASNTLQNFRTTNWSGNAGTSRYIAFAGLQHAMLKLREDPKFSGPLDGEVDGQPELHYYVNVKNQTNKTATTVTDKWGFKTTTYSDPYSTTEIPENSAKIESEVRLKLTDKKERSLSGVIGTAVWKPTGFVNAASARSAVMLQGGSTTKAYDFTKYTGGARDTKSTDKMDGYIDPLTNTTEDGAHLQTAEMMHISDTSKAEGDLTKPPDPTTEAAAAIAEAQAAALKARMAISAPDLAAALPPTPVTPTASVHYTGDLKPGAPGSIVPAKSPYPLSEAILELSSFPAETKEITYTDKDGKKQTATVSTPMTLPSNKAYKSISVPKDQTLILTGGQYYISDEFKIDGSIQIDSSKGDVIVYVGKTMTVNGEVNFQGDPATMQVYFTSEDKPIDPKTGLPIVRGFSTLNLNKDSKATMVAEGADLITRIDGARLLGAVSAEAVWMKNGASIEYDTNLKGRQMAGGSVWKLQGVYETTF
ncbi:hypothetical protein IV102_32730 [bacterium]|nr:hypothetical protein [bacterium]